MGVVSVKGIKVRAFHGCIDEEALVGGEFTVNVNVSAPFEPAYTTDNLEKAIDYVAISEIVINEMAIRSKLIETVAHRIIIAIEKLYHWASEVDVTIIKHRAPIEKDVAEVSVYLNSKDLL